MLHKKLLKIGLPPKEIEVFLASLALGPQSVTVIANHSKINRTTVYDIFKSLIKKGLAHKIEKGPITYFQVLDPQNLVSFMEREKNEYIKKVQKNQQEIMEIIPALKSLENPLSTKPKVKFFEGEKGIREAYEDTLKATETIRAYANVEEMHKALPNFFPEYYKRRTDANLFIRAICPNNVASLERQKRDKEELRKMKVVPQEQYSFSPELNVYDDKVLIVSWQEKMAILMQSKEVAELHKKTFDLLWEKLD